MNRDEFASDIARVEERLAAGRLRARHDWNELGAAVTRKTSWMPLALGALGVLAVGLMLRGRPRQSAGAHPAMPQQRFAHQTHSRWTSVLAVGGALARIITLPQVMALIRSLRHRGR